MEKAELKDVQDRIMKATEMILDYAQVACPSDNTYKALRSKILRIGNNTIRELERDYETNNSDSNSNDEFVFTVDE